MAQLGARLNGIEKVEGSNPSGSTVGAIAKLRGWSLLCYNRENTNKVLAGVVRHSVSELGE